MPMPLEAFHGAADAGPDLEDLVTGTQERSELLIDALTVSPCPHHAPRRGGIFAVILVAIARGIELVEPLLARDVPMGNQTAPRADAGVEWLAAAIEPADQVEVNSLAQIAALLPRPLDDKRQDVD